MCGIVGIISDSTHGVASDLSHALNGLKHRGPDSVGALLYYDHTLQDVVRRRKITGRLLNQVKLMGPEEDTQGMTVAFGHTRYKTTDGENDSLNSQPYTAAIDGIQLDLLFNGNIPNHEKIRRDHLVGYTSFATLGDTETLTRFTLHHIQEALKHSGPVDIRHAIRESVKRVLGTFPGGYSVIAKFEGETFAFKDPHGIRPLAMGRKGKTHIFSSENHFFSHIGYESGGELPHGSLIFPGSDPEQFSNPSCLHYPDVFEFVYLAKDESILYGVKNAKVRFDLGFSAASELREVHGDWQFDTVLAVPNGANIMRQGACQALGMDSTVPNGLVRKPHSERSFMASEQVDREKIVRDKFILIPEQIVGKKILLIDDSIVRGTTMKILVDMLLEAGAKSVDVLSSSPIVHYGDHYGIAMSTNELIGIDNATARRLNCSDIELKLFYDALHPHQKARLFYPSVSRFLDVFQKNGLPQVHAGYFNGEFING